MTQPSVSTHPAFAANTLPKMRQILNEVQLSDREREAVTQAISRTEDHWKQRHREAYDLAVGRRNATHDETIDVAKLLRDRAKETIEQLQTGRIEPSAARAWLRDALADHRSLVEQSEAIAATEEQLAAFDAMTPDDYQEHLFARFPSMEGQAPTLGALVTEENDASTHVKVRPQ
jgi:hypothetical protein